MRLGLRAVLAAMLFFIPGCFDTRSVVVAVDPPVDDPVPNGGIPAAPPGFPALFYPADNPPTPAKIELGRRLFFDPDLSRDKSISCATCHKPEGSFADPGISFTFGIDGHLTARNSPSLANVAYNQSLFADGRAPTLEAQALEPIIGSLEMDMDTVVLAARLSVSALYRGLFRKAWGDDAIDVKRITGAIASFERAMLSGGSPYDRFQAGDSLAIPAGAKRGAEVFFGGKAVCFRCHTGFNFTDQGFHNVGIDSLNIDPGRMTVTANPLDAGKFKTPSLRNIALTPPYMHDGRFNTLREVIDHYDSGGDPKSRDPLMGALGLEEGEISDLILFLESLSDSAFASDPRFRNPW
jgi:cytochrome c peroxidase